jgi:hypothetical protein
MTDAAMLYQAQSPTSPSGKKCEQTANDRPGVVRRPLPGCRARGRLPVRVVGQKTLDEVCCRSDQRPLSYPDWGLWFLAGLCCEDSGGRPSVVQAAIPDGLEGTGGGGWGLRLNLFNLDSQ